MLCYEKNSAVVPLLTRDQCKQKESSNIFLFTWQNNADQMGTRVEAAPWQLSAFGHNKTDFIALIITSPTTLKKDECTLLVSQTHF